ncbi:hypothetical protein L1785_05400 [Antribacter sp. KLBMP9083]|uniref:Uncharacterized protein n=1 Tax=Antribacter soli TaxID=2910976 RepID=A0AA41QBJ0_9MICO|nr:hypothetical protein [Antribacter soli]MCF4120409.1 hypothetical protein [Antribacter soli]
MSTTPSTNHSPAVRAAARVSARAAGASAAFGEVFAARRAELRARRAARRAGSPDDEGLESIEVVVLSVVGLGIVIALGAAIKALVDRYMEGLG